MWHEAERIYDEYLVAAARIGDTKAYERLAARWQPRLLRHAWRLVGDAELARDTVQDAWVEIVRGLPRLMDTGAFPAWAFRIVTRRAAKAIRRIQRGRRIDDAVTAEPQPDQPADDPARRSDAATVKAALAALPPDQRAAMALFYLEDLSVAEIAVALGVSAGTVKTRLMHARHKVRAALQGDDHA